VKLDVFTSSYLNILVVVTNEHIVKMIHFHICESEMWTRVETDERVNKGVVDWERGLTEEIFAAPTFRPFSFVLTPINLAGKGGPGR